MSQWRGSARRAGSEPAAFTPKSGDRKGDRLITCGHVRKGHAPGSAGDGERAELSGNVVPDRSRLGRRRLGGVGHQDSEILDAERLGSCEHYRFAFARSTTAGSAVSAAAALTRSLTESDSDAPGARDATRTPMPLAER